ncbi:MAG: MBL fold metallo-hydrolase [Candidatus Omnitrophica bacterium]|nr:MBL fold metallo-hydrolase [Candidatus Omnitrophota bacterium]
MQVKILFDSFSLGEHFLTGWGVAYLVDGKILFDTGEKGWSLFNNLEFMEVKLSKIEKVVISHDHWDHTGGLEDILEERSGLKVYVCRSFSKKFKTTVKSYGGKLADIKQFTKLNENIYSTGEIIGSYGGQPIAEQLLTLKTSKGLTILTGCAHPGIIKIIETVKANISDHIYLVLGEFHLIDKDKREVKLIVEKLKEIGVEKVGPTHCTGYEAIEIFKAEYGNNFVGVKVGQTIEV